MKLELLFSLVCITASLTGGTLEPYWPSPAALRPVGTAIKAPEVRFSSPQGVDIAPTRRTRSLDGTWKFSGLENSASPFTLGEKSEWGNPEFDDASWQRVEVPRNYYTFRDSSNRSYYDSVKRESPYYRGGYRMEFSLSEQEVQAGRVLLYFGAVGYEANLYVNGQKAGYHHGDFTPFETDITPQVKAGVNRIALEVLSDFGGRLGNVERIKHVYGAQFSKFSIKGGIWQGVELRLEPAHPITRLQVNPRLAERAVELEFTILNFQNQSVTMELGAAVTGALKEFANQMEGAAESRKIVLVPGENRGTITVPLKNPVFWSPETPHLYYATLYLTEGKQLHSARSERFGYREFVRKGGHFYLNGKKIYLMGDSLIVSDTVQEGQIIEKISSMRRYGINCLRTAHQPAVPRLYEVADELGMMINNEWGWSFDSQLDYPAFEKNNLAEIRQWIERDYNHPSVVMWSGGNEISHHDPAVGEQLDRQVRLIRSLDSSGRPVGSFSGSASIAAYGAARRETDYLDLHDYMGTTRGGAWTLWPENAEFRKKQLMESYGKDYLNQYPVIFWENIGLGWGWKSDPNFKPSDFASYYRYACETETEWATPNGIGFAGSIGLARALAPEGKTYAQNIYGKRMIEMFRRDPQFMGVATGWFHNLQPGMTVWTQPTLLTLTNHRGVPPRNLWSGRPTALNLTILHQGLNDLGAGTLRLDAVSAALPEAEGKTLLTLTVPGIVNFGKRELPVECTVPAEMEGQIQLRLTYEVAGKEVGRNFYDLFVQPPALLQTKLNYAGKIAILNVGSRNDCETFARRLGELGLTSEIVGARDSLAGFRLAVIPPARENSAPLNFDRFQLFDWINNGGALLVLEQTAANGSFLEQFRLTAPGLHYLLKIPNPSPFVDLIFPEHPIFQGLAQSNFDTWENPAGGSVIEHQIAPFSRNSIAARPPLLGQLSTQSAVFEATYGKGHLLWSQLVADKLWGVDSSASRYLVNLLRYMTGGKRFAKITPLDLKSATTGYETGAAARFHLLDLSKQANRAFRDEVAGDGKGGWTDQGQNDMRNIPAGQQRAAGIPFQILDGERACIALRGKHNPDFAEKVTGIPVNARLSRLFFLHTAGYLGGGTVAGRYVIHYEDGQTTSFDMRSGKNIGDWWGCGFLPEAKLGIIVANPVKDQVGSYVAVWLNPHPAKKIVSLDILSAETARRQEIDWLPEPAPTTFVLGITGEEYRDFRIDIDTVVNPAKWASGGNAKKGQPPASSATREESLPDGTKRRIAELTFPEGTKESVPVVMTAFRVPPERDPGEAGYLNFDLRAESTGELTLMLPAKGWRESYRVTLTLDGAKQWQRMKLPLPPEQREKMKGKELLGELWFYNSVDWRNKTHLAPAAFAIADITLD
ncbi:MAG: glycoside hydrolase family 2 protein [Victivallis vadensis]